MLRRNQPTDGNLVHDYERDIKLIFDLSLRNLLLTNWNRHLYYSHLSPRYALALHRVREYAEEGTVLDIAHLRVFLHMAQILKPKPPHRLTDIGVHHLFDPKLRAAIGDRHLIEAIHTVIKNYHNADTNTILPRTKRAYRTSRRRNRKASARKGRVAAKA